MISGGKSIIKRYRVNQEIVGKEVRLISETGEQLGTMPLFKAREIASERGYDIVEVAPQASPPVCRLIDFGKFKYEQTKKEREARKKQKSILVREVQFRPKIGDHDVDFKVRTIKKLIGEGDKVKVSIIFRGREITHPDLGKALLDRVAKELEGEVLVERAPAMDGRRMIMILAPTKQKKPASEPTDTGIDIDIVKEPTNAEAKDS
ncbi:MAG: translation initiation factor IF-3 [Chloroflexota bacterium]|nr:translation initiation factor IF-3 [Chloroflexota bacterium]